MASPDLLPLTRADLQRLARTRLADATALLKARRYSAAYYLAGYAVECALKACIARQTRQAEFPDLGRVRESYTHDLLRLVSVAGLEAQRRREELIEPRFADSWRTVRDWSEQARYRQYDRSYAVALLAAITNPEYGVLQWVGRFW